MRCRRHLRRAAERGTALWPTRLPFSRRDARIGPESARAGTAQAPQPSNARNSIPKRPRSSGFALDASRNRARFSHAGQPTLSASLGRDASYPAKEKTPGDGRRIGCGSCGAVLRTRYISSSSHVWIASGRVGCEGDRGAQARGRRAVPASLLLRVRAPARLESGSSARDAIVRHS